MDKLREPQKIVEEHAAAIRSLLTRLEKKSRDDITIANLDRLKKRINMLRRTMGDDEPIKAMTPLMKEYQDKILNREEEFFLGMNARKKYVEKHHREPSRDEEYIFELIDSVRGHYSKSTKDEKDFVYHEVLTLFNCCIEYELATLSK